MRRQSKKLSGPAFARYIRRFYADVPGLPVATAEQLTARSLGAFTSVRVRASLMQRPTGLAQIARSGLTQVVAPSSATAPKPPEVPAAPEPAATFDPHAIGLVPTFQREGRDGLIAKLSAIGSADQLRKIARSQQIVLGEALRGPDVPADTVRHGIADAVAKRIADRRAAAG